MGQFTMLRVVENGEPPDLIDIKEAAALLRVRPASIYRAMNDGRLTRYRRLFDGHMMVRRSEVARQARYRPERPADDQAQSQAG